MENVFLFAGSFDLVKYAFTSSDLFGQGIVVFLFLISTVTWVVMIEKGLALSRAKRSSEDFLAMFRSKSYPLRCFRDALNNPSPVARIYELGALQLLEFYNLPREQAEFYGSDRVPVKALTEAEIEAVETALDKAISDQLLLLEERISFLATAVSLAPFMGLFGTVWGIMLAFCALAIEGKASIGALAPGVSGALLTTVVGLLVAIPSLIGNNILTHMLRKITVYMDNFEAEFIARLNLEKLEKHNG